MPAEVHSKSILQPCRWKEAAEDGKAPPVVLAATHERALDMVSLELLKQHATGE